MKSNIWLKVIAGYVHLTLFVLSKRSRHLVGCYLKGSIRNRKFIVDPKRQLVYLNNPKVGCTSIKTCMFGDQIDVHSLGVQKLPQEAKPFYTFTFVRNPYERLVSCFEDKSNRHPIIWENYLSGYLKGIHDFDLFVNRVCGIPDRLAEPHFAGQYWLIYDKTGKSLVDFVGKIEEMKAGFAPIQERFDLPALPHKHRAASLTGRNWMDYYTPDTAELVYWKYKKDFIALGYTDEYEKLKAYLAKKYLLG